MMQSVAGPSLLTSVPTIEEVLHDHASELGHDFIAYRNHAYRVVNLCAAIVKDRADLEKIAVAAVFHDLGIWTNKTFDYIAPSVALAREYLAAHGRAAWIPEIERMIADHHKITPSHANHDSLVEPFRRADWIDVTRGLRTFGLPRPFDPVGARWLAERRVSLAPGAVDSRKIPQASADAVADGQTVTATGSGPDADRAARKHPYRRPCSRSCRRRTASDNASANAPISAE